MPCCSAVGCSNRSEDGFKLYSIPSGKNDQERRQVWLRKIGRLNFVPSRSSSLCGAHFEDCEFERNIPGKLKPNAIPTIFPHLANEGRATSPTPNFLNRDKIPVPYETDYVDKVRRDHGYSIISWKKYQDENGLLGHPYGDGADWDESLNYGTEFRFDDDDSCEQPEYEVIITVPNEDFGTADEEHTTCSPDRTLLESTRTRGENSGLRPSESQAVNESKLDENEFEKALTIRFSCGFSGYEGLVNIGYSLPSESMLLRHVERIPFVCGISDEVFRMLKNKVTSLSNPDKVVSLIVERITLQPCLEYDDVNSRVVGFPSLGSSTDVDSLATHALIYIIKGLHSCWTQTIGYEVTNNSFSALALKDTLLDIIETTHSIGLHVNSLTIDVEGSLGDVLCEFGMKSIRAGNVCNFVQHPVVESAKLYFFTPFPQLLINLRNYLLKDPKIVLSVFTVDKYNLPSRVVSLKHVFEMLELRSKYHLNLVSNLKASGLTPIPFEEQLVGPAEALFSFETADGLRYLVNNKMLTAGALTTVWFLEQVCEWYQLVMLRSTEMPVSQLSLQKLKEDVNFLTEFVACVRTATFRKDSTSWCLLQKGIVVSTTTLLVNCDEMLPRKCLLKNVEVNVLAGKQFRNACPTALELQNALRTISLSQLFGCSEQKVFNLGYPDSPIEIPGSQTSYHCDMLSSSTVSKLASHTECDSMKDSTLVVTNPKRESYLSPMKDLTLYNLSTYCVSEFIKTISCKDCEDFVCSEVPSVLNLDSNKCFCTNTSTFASVTVFDLVKTAESVFLSLGDNVSNLSTTVDSLIQECEKQISHFTFPECHSVKKELLRYFLRICAFGYLHEGTCYVDTVTTEHRQEEVAVRRSSRSVTHKYTYIKSKSDIPSEPNDTLQVKKSKRRVCIRKRRKVLRSNDICE